MGEVRENEDDREKTTTSSKKKARLSDIKDELKEVMHNSYERWGVHNECIRNLDKAWSDVKYLTTRVNPILELWSRVSSVVLLRRAPDETAHGTLHSYTPIYWSWNIT